MLESATPASAEQARASLKHGDDGSTLPWRGSHVPPVVLSVSGAGGGASAALDCQPAPSEEQIRSVYIYFFLILNLIQYTCFRILTCRIKFSREESLLTARAM